MKRPTGRDARRVRFLAPYPGWLLAGRIAQVRRLDRADAEGMPWNRVDADAPLLIEPAEEMLIGRRLLLDPAGSPAPHGAALQGTAGLGRAALGLRLRSYRFA